MSSNVDILIVGAGPTGLTAAIEAIRNGLSVKIIDIAPSGTNLSRALAIQSRTLECLNSIDRQLPKKLLAAGKKFKSFQYYFSVDNSGKLDKAASASVEFDELEWGDAEFPIILGIPQYDTERILVDYLENELKMKVKWGVGLENFVNCDDPMKGVIASLTNGDIVNARWIIGCDGGRSKTAEIGGILMKKKSLGVKLFLADVKTSCSDLEKCRDVTHFFMGSSDGLLTVFPLKDGAVRVIAQVDESENKIISGICDQCENGVPSESAKSKAMMYIDLLLSRRTGLEFGASNVSWLSHIELREGVRDNFRSKSHPSCFIAGDAAHVHSPAGGQGMNTSIQDAHNLIWKIAAACRLEKEICNNKYLESSSIDDYKYTVEKFLSSYEDERAPTVRDMVGKTSKATNVVSFARNYFVNKALSFVAPYVFPLIQNNFARPVGMLDLVYRESPIISRKSGCGGRIPNPEVVVIGDRLKEIEIVLGDNVKKVHLHDLLNMAPPGGHSLIEFTITAPENHTCKVNIDGTNPVEYSFKQVSDYKAICKSFEFQLGEKGVVLIRPDLIVAGVWSDVSSMAKSELFVRGDGGNSSEIMKLLKIPMS